MEQIQGTRLQQDVNLLINGPSPMPNAASNLFTFMAMRLQQSFMNLNCGSFGMNNDVSTTADGNGVVVAACFVTQVQPITPGQGNPMAGTTTCPATASDATPSANPSQAGQGQGQGGHHPSPSGMSRPQAAELLAPSPTNRLARLRRGGYRIITASTMIRAGPSRLP